MRVEIKGSAFGLFAILTVASAMTLGWAMAMWAAAAIGGCLLLHESAHALTARVFAVRVKAIGISVLGGYTIRERSNCRRREALTTLAGPAVNLAMFWILTLVSGKFAEYIAGCNLILAISNLVPVGPSDGLRLCKLLLTRQV